MLDFLQGKKTYVCAVAAGIALILFYAGIINKTVLQLALSLAGVGGVAAIRSALQKLIDKLG